MKKFVCAFGMLILFFAAPLFAGDLYWVSFNGDDGGGNFLMLIDSEGTIVHPPIEVATEAQLGGDCDCGTAMTLNPSGSKLFMYSANENDEVFRITINPATMETLSVKKLPLRLDEDFLSVTQRSSPAFLVGEKFDSFDLLVAYGLDSKGNLNGTSWRVSPRATADSSNVTADGLFTAVENSPPDTDQAYIQALSDKTGFPQGDPVVGIAVTDFDALDLSNALPNGRRLLVVYDYNNEKVVGQFVDSSTGVKKGASFTIVAEVDNEEYDNCVAVDPKGRFVIFTNNAEPCDEDGVFYQKIGSNGLPSGAPIELVGCDEHEEFGIGDDFMNVDVLSVLP